LQRLNGGSGRRGRSKAMEIYDKIDAKRVQALESQQRAGNKEEAAVYAGFAAGLAWVMMQLRKRPHERTGEPNRIKNKG